ncbi:MAG: hypothetical protein AAGI53_00965 [Planctomycetota bacterium]
MPVLFVGYALAVWALAARWRRAPSGFVAVVIGVFGLIAINWLHIKLEDWTDGTIHLPVLQSIMYPYTGLVGVVGAYIACLPRIASYQCRTCHYDLRGLAADVDCCPECGAPTKASARSTRRSGVDRANVRASDVRSNTA